MANFLHNKTRRALIYPLDISRLPRTHHQTRALSRQSSQAHRLQRTQPRGLPDLVAYQATRSRRALASALSELQSLPSNSPPGYKHDPRA